MPVNLGELYNLPSDQIYGPRGEITLPSTTATGETVEQLLHRLYRGTQNSQSSGAGSPDDTQWQNLREGLLYGNASGPLREQLSNDPETQRILEELQYSANLQDKFSVFGDQFFQALFALGAATGGAAAFGGFSAPAAGAGAGIAGAEAIAAPLPVVGAQGAYATGPIVGTLGPEFGAATTVAPLTATPALAAPAGSFSVGGGGLFGTGVTAGQALKGASLASSAANLASNPSGGSAGSFAGSLAGAATGIPGASTVGSVAGGTAGRAIDSPDYGGTPVAESSTGSDIAQILAAALGLGGAGLGLADQARLRGQQSTLFGQSEEQLRLINQLAALYNTQGQQAYAQAQAIYPEQVAQRQQDRDNRATIFGERQAIGNRLQDPTQVSAGAQSMFNPYAAGVQDETVKAINRSMALQGTGDGGVANLAAARALVPVNAQLYQQAMQNFLGSQTTALGAFNEPSPGPYTPNPPQPPGYQNPQLAQTLNPVPAIGGGSPGEIIGNLIKLLGLSNTPGVYQALSNLIGGGSNTGTQQTADAAIQGFRNDGFTQGVPEQASQTFAEAFPDAYSTASDFDYSSLGDIDYSAF